MSANAPKDDGRMSYPYEPASTDEGVAAAILNALLWHPEIPNDQVRVEVLRGCAVLRGKVANASHSKLAETTASATPGVIAVTNHLTIEP